MWKICFTINLVKRINEIEWFLHERRWLLDMQQMDNLMVDTKPLKYYVVPTDDEPHSSIMHQSIVANNFELKHSLIGMIQQDKFSGLPTENLKLHLSIFVDNYGTLKANGVDQNTIRLRLFPFSIRAWARAWL